jgi:hypothetical protein
MIPTMCLEGEDIGYNGASSWKFVEKYFHILSETKIY